MNMASDETSRVLMVYFMLGMLRMGGVIAERMELQDKGVLEVDCPVCLGQLTSGNGFVTFHLLECGHRCEAARTCAVCEAARTCAVRPPTCVRQSRRQSRPPLPSSAFPLRVSQGPRGMPAPNRGNTRCRRRRGAHMPALPWCVTRHAHLCDEGCNGVTCHMEYLAFRNMASGIFMDELI